MNCDVVTVEIGSTITKVNCFDGIFTENPIHIGQAIALTTINEKDVSIGVNNALLNLETKLGKKITPKEFLVNSSAAGGLKMAVFGLTYDMTAKAAREASLGAGAIIKYISAGKIKPFLVEEIEDIQPNIVLLAGGLDYGDTDITYHNAKILAELNINCPFIYAGNKQLINPIKKIFDKNGKKLSITKNVYPNVDTLDIEPAREIIQHTFSEHIIHAHGMESLEKITQKEIIPTPYAVLKIAEKIYENIGEVVVVDVGGATTDIHSVCDDKPENSLKRIQPEPLSKRTVEGDLGVFVNASNLNDIEEKKNKIKTDLTFLKPLPDSNESVAISRVLCEKAVYIAMRRHAGEKKVSYTPTGKKEFVIGKDLSEVKYIIGTGGALSRLEGGIEILKKQVRKNGENILLPEEGCKYALDKKYIFSALGTITFHYPEANIESLIKQSINI